MSDVISGTPGSLSFKTVIMSSLYKISDAAAVAEPPGYLLDTIWAMLKPFMIEEDVDAWEKHAMGDDYQCVQNKARLISLLLYRNGLLPEKEHIPHRKFAIAIKSRTKDTKGLSTHTIEDIELTQFLMRHLIVLVALAKKYMEYGVHIDVLWSILSPYITEEDYDNWEENDTMYGSPNSIFYSPYVWSIGKIRICMDVMNRADFLLQTGMVDAPRPTITDEGEITVT